MKRKHALVYVTRTLLRIWFCMLVIGWLFMGGSPVCEAAAFPKEKNYGLNNPRIENGKVTWDCVYFGSY